MLTNQSVHDMKGTQFPFGVFNIEPDQQKKVLIRKKFRFDSLAQYEAMHEKIDKLKSISHKNSINLRSIKEGQNFIDLYYPYVNMTLQDSFIYYPNQTAKEIHKQFIELAIYLAKNNVTTSFEPSYCGVLINQSKSILKYFLFLPKLTITNDRNKLQRFVQIFNVQSMNFVDNLLSQTANETINESISQRTFKSRTKLFPNKDGKKNYNMINTLKDRKLSGYPYNNLKDRKQSTLSRQIQEVSQIHKQHKASTRVSGQSFQTFHSLISHKPFNNYSELSKSKIQQKQPEKKPENESPTLKRYGSEKYEKHQVQKVVNRSKIAIENLKQIRQTMKSYKTLFGAIREIHL